MADFTNEQNSISCGDTLPCYYPTRFIMVILIQVKQHLYIEMDSNVLVDIVH